MESVQYEIKSPVGDLFLVASEKGLRGLFLDRQDIPTTASLNPAVPIHQILQEAVSELREYFAGERQEFSVPLDLLGTPFQKQVWEELMRIPFGQTASYKQIAERIGNPKATRAVGAANGKNPVCIIVPCHRVIAADGSLGGYSGGLPFKRGLLSIEGVRHQLSL